MPTELVSFLDNDRAYPPDSTGYNKVGIITANGTAVYESGRTVKQSPESCLAAFPKYRQHPPNGLNPENVDTFFLRNFPSLELFQTGLHKIVARDRVYFLTPIHLPIHDDIDASEHKRRCLDLFSKATKLDILFTFDTSSSMSHLISRVDRGPWSHVAMITGDGTVIETVTSGVREIPLLHYSSRKYRLGLYRFTESVSNADIDQVIHHSRSEIGMKYAYRKAALAGLQKWLGKPKTIPTPNDLAASEYLNLISRV